MNVIAFKRYIVAQLEFNGVTFWVRRTRERYRTIASLAVTWTEAIHEAWVERVMSETCGLSWRLTLELPDPAAYLHVRGALGLL